MRSLTAALFSSLCLMSCFAAAAQASPRSALNLADTAIAAGTVTDASTATASTSDLAATAQQKSTATIASDFQCGLLTCSYVFSKANTNFIADVGASTWGLCFLTGPAQPACLANFAVVVTTAILAKSRGQCLRFNWLKATIAAWPSIEGGSRCR
jgi:hypothetical protein